MQDLYGGQVTDFAEHARLFPYFFAHIERVFLGIFKRGNFFLLLRAFKKPRLVKILELDNTKYIRYY